MKKLSPSHLVVLLFLIGIGAVTYWFLENFERISEEKYVGYQGEARYNPLLAAQRLLQQSGTTAQTVYSFARLSAQLTPQDTLIFFRYEDSDLNISQHQTLLNWIKSGGHLIINHFATDDSEEKTLFNQFGITFHDNELDDDSFDEVPLTEFTWHRYSLKVAFDPLIVLETHDNPYLSIESDYGTHLLMYKVGQGYLTVLNDLQFINNDQIGEYDHATFLWYLVHHQRPVAKTWLLLLRNTDIPSLATLLWQHAQPLMISSLILLILWLWSISLRFGPLLLSPSQTRRRLLEHIEASGHFLWRYQQSYLLLLTVRQTVLKRLEQVHPEWSLLPRTELCQRLAQLSKLSPQQIETALYHVQLSETLFTQAVQTLTTIKEKL